LKLNAWWIQLAVGSSQFEKGLQLGTKNWELKMRKATLFGTPSIAFRFISRLDSNQLEI
jgi:hypothetical protein